MNAIDRPENLKHTHTNTLLWGILSLIEGCLVLVIAALALYITPASSTLDILPEWASHLKPEHEIFLYRIFVIAVITIFAAGLLFLRKRIGTRSLSHSLAGLVIAETLVLWAISVILFKTYLYKNMPQWRMTVIVFLCASLIIKFLWPKWCSVWSRAIRGLQQTSRQYGPLQIGADLIFPVLIVLIVYIPDTHGVIAKIFSNDLFYHYDGIIMAAAWASLKGCVFFIDVISQYGMGMPAMIGRLTQWFGGFSHENVLRLLMIANILYLIFYYAFLRYWLKSILIAAIGTLLFIRLQVFHFGEAGTLIWQFPTLTTIRYIFELPFFFLILLHLKSARRLYLILASFFVGVTLFSMTDSGVYLLVSYLVYLVFLLIPARGRDILLRSPKDIPWIIFHVIFPFVVSLVLFSFAAGKLSIVFSREFLSNFSEFARIYLNGFFALPFTTPLGEQNYFGFFSSILVVLLYLLNLLISGSFWFGGKDGRRFVLLSVLSIYGLCLFHYHVLRSAPVHFLLATGPLILIGSFWLCRWADERSPEWRNGILMTVLFLTGFSLFMTEAYRTYPNMIAGKSDIFSQEKAAFAREFRFQRDSELIRQMTRPEQKVPLFSSFETPILMEANRKPFFYYIPFVNTRHLKMLDYGGTYLFTQERLDRTIQQLKNEKPRYVFIEKKLFFRQIPKVYFEHYTSLRVILTYLYEHYRPVANGEFLVGLGRVQGK